MILSPSTAMESLDSSVSKNSGARLRGLLNALRKRSAFSHSIDDWRIVETHISIILLAGSFAYKFKKPLDLGFLDFHSLEKRRHFCEEELRLNRRTAPELYLGVISITGSEAEPEIEGAGATIEYAVKMRRFPVDAELSGLLKRGTLTLKQVEGLAVSVAIFHHNAAVASAESPWGSPTCLHENLMNNFSVLAADSDERYVDQLKALCSWVEAVLEVDSCYRERKSSGWVRECHGDLHVGNLVLLEDRVVPFDCLEFSPALRWGDVMGEVAFLVMDLDYRGHPALSTHFLNDYLACSGDYAGLKVLPLYLVYRAMVRAKVAVIRGRQLEGGQRWGEAQQKVEAHLALALRYTQRSLPTLVITYGVSGSGKSTLSGRLLGFGRLIRIRADVERKRLHGLSAETKSDSQQDEGIYSAAATGQTYARLEALASSILQAGFSVLVDATFLRRSQRLAFKKLAVKFGVPYHILLCEADEAILRQRVAERLRRGGDVSEADVGVLEKQLIQCEVPGMDEQGECVSAREADGDMSHLAGQLGLL